MGTRQRKAELAVVELAADLDGRPALRLVADRALDRETRRAARWCAPGPRAGPTSSRTRPSRVRCLIGTPCRDSSRTSRERAIHQHVRAALFGAGLWHCAQDTFSCAPLSANEASRVWSNFPAGAKASAVWQAAQPPWSGRRTGCRAGVVWQSTHSCFASNCRAPNRPPARSRLDCFWAAGGASSSLWHAEQARGPVRALERKAELRVDRDRRGRGAERPRAVAGRAAASPGPGHRRPRSAPCAGRRDMPRTRPPARRTESWPCRGPRSGSSAAGSARAAPWQATQSISWCRPSSAELELRVGGAVERAGRPAGHAVTRRALALVRPGLELSAVIVGVAVGARGEGRPHHHLGGCRTSSPRWRWCSGCGTHRTSRQCAFPPADTSSVAWLATV